MRILITGAGGQLARALVMTAPAEVQVRAVSRAECDVTELPIIEKVFSSFRPDVVINTAAFTSVDAAEENKELAFQVNAIGAENVAKVAELCGSTLIHISTDYVFDGTRSTPYLPDALANPINVYGASKLEGERLTLSAASHAVIVRTSWLYSMGRNNFLTNILDAIRSARPLAVVNDQKGSPTSAHEFALAIWKMRSAKLRGIYHWANLGSASRYEFAREIARVAQQQGFVGREPVIAAVTTDSYARRAKRPAYSVLDSTRLSECLRVLPSAWREALQSDIARDLSRARSKPEH